MDIYNDVMLRRWSLDLASGRQECADDAVDIGLISAEDRSAIEAKNAAVHAAIEAVEAYEGDTEAEVAEETAALARLRAGEASEDDQALIAATWGAPVEITLPTPEQLVRQNLPVLERWQFLAVVDLAELGPSIEAAIAAIEDPIERVVASRRYRSSAVYRRLDPLFEGLRSAVGLTDEHVDYLWDYAGALRAH